MTLEVQNLYAGYEDSHVLQDVSLQIPERKITMMIGPNGCGKSTLLKTMAGIITPQKGEVLLDGESLKDMKRRQIAKRLALLPQSPLVPEGLRVRELVQYGRFPYQKALQSLNHQRFMGNEKDRNFDSCGCICERAVRWAAAAGVDRYGTGTENRYSSAG